MSLNIPGFALQPSATRVPTATNYMTSFDFLNQYLPDTYEKEFERYGNRTISSFLRMVGAEMPSNSDLIKWAEQGRLHIKYTDVATGAAAADSQATFTVSDTLIPANQVMNSATASQIGIKNGQTVMISGNAGFSGISNKGIVSGVTATTFVVHFFEAGGYTGVGTGVNPNEKVSVFIYGSEFKKASVADNIDSLEPFDTILENNPIIIRDKYAVSGSDMAQIGWIEVSTEDGADGYLWYLKAEHETRMRFEDYLETAMVEAVKAKAPTVAVGGQKNAQEDGFIGSEGMFAAIESRGNIFTGAITALSDFDSIIERLDKQGAIEENVLFLNRQTSFEIDDMLAAQNSYGNGGSSYGLFDNDEEMALNLGFTGFRRAYDFYKTDWKYLNDPAMRGGLVGGAIDGVLVPAGSTNVYDQVLGRNAKRPFLHVRYRASETEDRRYKTWVTGSAGGVRTSSLDAMEVHFLSERALCVMGANNFVLFK
tara:strand:- start:548 stop:1993 length:1446 start_codon:yes stop_codon:yes gene_type:complete